VKRNLHAGRPRSGGLSLNVFTEAELDDIHLASLEILERTGVWVEADDALDIFSDGGCVVDRETRVVRIPPYLVEDAIRSAPPKGYLCGRDPGQDIVLEGGRVYVSNFDEGIMVVDARSGEYRHPVLTDVHEAARLVDALPDIDTYESAVHPSDVPEETASLHKWLAAIENTGKPVGTEATSAYDCRKLVEMGAVIAGGEDEFRRRPLIGFGVCAVSPLKLPRDATEVIIESARAGCSDTILSMAMSGGSSPVTLAGTLSQHNAEVLAGIVLAQLVERGCEVVYGTSTTAMDLKLAAASVGSPELALFSAACAQIARRYLIPSFVAGL
jgi:trimethylamine---corrinoid protein Co-methyltransferase